MNATKRKELEDIVQKLNVLLIEPVNPDGLQVIEGKIYRNKKHGTLYQVLDFVLDSETLELKVRYERFNPEERGDFPFVRPVSLFQKKFEDVK